MLVSTALEGPIPVQQDFFQVAPETILAAFVWIASNCFFDSDE